jgi:hypothetical protein
MRNDTTNKSSLLTFLRYAGVCPDGMEWATASPAPTVSSCPRGEWLLWLGAKLDVDPERLRAAMRPTVLRALRVHAPAALDAAGLHDHADRLRALPDDVSMEGAARETAWRAVEPGRLKSWAGLPLTGQGRRWPR